MITIANHIVEVEDVDIFEIIIDSTHQLNEILQSGQGKSYSGAASGGTAPQGAPQQQQQVAHLNRNFQVV